jgi:hypothetical protein
MATGGGRIYLPKAIGVDRGHPWWPDLYFICFFFLFAGKVAGGGWWMAASSQVAAWGGSRPPQWPDLSLFFFFFGSLEKLSIVGSGWQCLGKWSFIWLLD